MSTWRPLAAEWRPLLALGVLLSLVGCAPRQADPPARPGPIHLRYASPYPPTHPFSRADVAWIHHVEAASGGRLRIDPYWGGVTISSDQSVLELKHGVADIALITPIYQRAGVKTIKTQTGFYVGADTPEQQVATYRCLEKTYPVFTRELAGVHVLAVQGGSLAHIITRSRTVRSLDDLKGLRLRAPTEVAVALRRFGVSPSTMPMAEVYSALSKGTIDGVAAPSDTLQALHFSEVARHIYTLPVARGGYPARAISDRAYLSLPADLRQLLDRSRDYWEAQLAQQVRRAESSGADFGRREGVLFTAPSAQDESRFARAEIEVARAEAQRLKSIGVEGPAILAAAQAFIAARNGNPGSPCPA